MYFSLVLNDLSPSLLSGTRANDARAFRAWKCSTWHSDPTWTSQAGNSLCIPLHVLIICCQHLHVVTKHCQFIHIILHQQRKTCPVSYLHASYVVIQSDYYVASCCTLYIGCSHDFLLQDVFFSLLKCSTIMSFQSGSSGTLSKYGCPLAYRAIFLWFSELCVTAIILHIYLFQKYNAPSFMLYISPTLFLQKRFLYFILRTELLFH